MKVVIFNGKGGVGKSTIAANLATISNSVLLDADPQATCCYWRDRRNFDCPEVTDVSLGRVAIRLRSLKTAIVDLPGASVPGVQDALSAAQLILIPVSYDQATLDALPATLELVRSVQRPMSILLNRLHPRTNIDNILASLAPLNVPICSSAIRERANHRDWWANGEVAADHLDTDAGQDISLVWQWIMEKQDA
ncbi:MAG: ParA family protein [Snowella sp.]|nr:ParA family protein [Snowella sp.]